MSISRRNFLRWTAGAAALPPLARPAAAQDSYPSRPIRLLVGFSPGSTSDVIGRLFTKGAAPVMGQQFVVENKPGAVGSIAAQYVAHSAADGYTLLVLAVGTLTSLITKSAATVDVAKDLLPVSLLAGGPFVLVVNPASDIRTVADLVARARAKPGEVLYGSVGVGGVPQLTTESFAQRAGVKLTGITYPGGPQVINDLIGARITMGFTGLQDTLGQIIAGKLRALTTTATKRLGVLPDVPTMAESGMAGLESSLWTALMAPAGTPRTVVEKLASAAKAAMHAPDVVETMNHIGYEPYDSGPDHAGAFLRAEIERWSQVARTAGIRS